MKSSLTPLFSLKKFFVVAVCCLTMISAQSQFITVQPSVSTQLNIYTDISLWVNTPAGQTVNMRFNYFSSGDTISTQTQSDLGLGYSQQYVFEDVIIACDSIWNGYVDVWITGQDTIQSNLVSWSIPCAGPVSIQLQGNEIVDVGFVYSFDYNSGGAPAAIYWLTSIDNEDPVLHSTTVFGIGTYTDTLEVSAGQAYSVCNVEISNGISVPVFLLECMSGLMDSFTPSAPEATFVTSLENDTLVTSLTVAHSGGFNSNFTVKFEKALCDGSFELYEEYDFNFTNQIVIDSLIEVPVLFNLPQAPAWKVTLTGSNESFTMVPTSTVIDIALDAEPVVTLELEHIGNGFYEAVTNWNDDGAGNVILYYYVGNNLVGQITPTQNPVLFSIPTQISAYSGAVVEVTMESNACLVASTFDTVVQCPQNPTHILETATNITTTSAIVQLAYVNFGGCVEEAMVGIILVGVDTVWAPVSVDTEISSNYLIQLTNLEPGMTYVYRGVLYAEGQYFNTAFSLSFTTLSAEPVITQFSVNWDMSMLATIFVHYNTGDYFTSVGIRVFHDGPMNPSVEIFDAPATEGFISLDYNVSGQYGIHQIIVQLYDMDSGQIFQTISSTHTYQVMVSVEEINRTIDFHDRIDMYNLAGQLIQSFSRGQVLNPKVSEGVYLFVGWNGNSSITSKLKL